MEGADARIGDMSGEIILTDEVDCAFCRAKAGERCRDQRSVLPYGHVHLVRGRPSGWPPPLDAVTRGIRSIGE